MIKIETCIPLEIILNVFKYLAESLSIQILILGIAPLSLISVIIFCEFPMLQDVYNLLNPQRRAHFIPGGADTHIWQHFHQKH